MKTMNKKMAINTYLSTSESEKQTKQTRTDRTMGVESVLMVARWEGCGGTGEEVRGVRSTNRWSQNSHGDVKYSTGNAVAKELIRMTTGHEQWWGDCLRQWEGGVGE